MYLSVAQALDIEELHNGLREVNMDSDVRNVGRTKLPYTLEMRNKMYADATKDTMENPHRTQFVLSAKRLLISHILQCHIVFYAKPEKRRAWDRSNVTLVLPARMLVVLVYALSVNLDKRRTGD